MKRKIDICRKCGKFCHDDEGMMCLASTDRIIGMVMDYDNFVSSVLGIPRNFFLSEEKSVKPSRNSDFEQKDIPEECEMKDVYLIGEWANEEKD